MSDTTWKRIILEMGTGNDIRGQDYTKAAIRAVQDALHHSSLALFTSLSLPHDGMRVRVHVGVQQPDAVDRERVAAEIPYGEVTVDVETGGLDIPYPEQGGVLVMATVGVAAYVALPAGRFTLD